MILDAEDALNKTASIFQERDIYENIFNLFDNAKILTRMTQKLHPTMFNCINSADWVARQAYTRIVLDNGYDFKIYLMNFVYNFGHIFDNLRDVYLFLAEDPRGRVDSVARAGFSLG